MAKEMTVTFPGGKRVDAHIGGQTIRTDQSPKRGGEGSAPEPFNLFFASIATCVGIYALEFCTNRNLSTEGLEVTLRSDRDPAKKLFTPIRIEVKLPSGFPEKYHEALKRSCDLCTVKKHIVNPPEFEIELK